METKLILPGHKVVGKFAQDQCIKFIKGRNVFFRCLSLIKLEKDRSLHISLRSLVLHMHQKEKCEYSPITCVLFSFVSYLKSV